MISGVYENVVATTLPDLSIRYWAEFGFRPVAEGTLTAEAAGALYGHASPLRAVRLQHADTTTHGLLRLFIWETLRDQGIGKAPPLTIGSRWFMQRCADIMLIADAFMDARDAGEDVIVTPPTRAQLRLPEGDKPTILKRRVGVREMMTLSPQLRQAFFQRYGYDRPGYGTIDPAAPLKTSEFTHSSFVIADDTHGAFYLDTLGMTVAFAQRVMTGDEPGNAETLMVRPEDRWTIMGFKSPSNICGMFQFYRPMFPTGDVSGQSSPGSRGLCLSTFRVDDIDAYHARVQDSAARAVTPVLPNEFGEPSFSFVAPDGVFWTIVGEPRLSR
ncbi:MAG: hypothetical protein NZ518_04485 [Dehalococcoidia bacterium]|nr:hypothetical protein [Dehalococcoidia bacterium]